MGGLKELKGTKHGHRAQQCPSSPRLPTWAIWGGDVGTQGTAQADTRFMWTFVVPKAPSCLCNSHQSSVYPFSHLSFHLSSTQPSTHLPDHPPTSHPNRQQQPFQTPHKDLQKPQYAVGSRGLQRVPGEDRRQEASSLKPGAAGLLSTPDLEETVTKTPQSRAAVHPHPQSSAGSGSASTWVITSASYQGLWEVALGPQACHTTQNSMSLAVHCVPCLPTVCSLLQDVSCLL